MVRGRTTGPLRLLFDCHHDRIFNQPAPNVGDQVFCLKCNKPRIVTGAVLGWYLRCQSCQLGRTYGEARITCMQAAARHKNKRGGHVVAVFHDNKLVTTLGNVRESVLDGMVHLDDDGDEIPF